MFNWKTLVVSALALLVVGCGGSNSLAVGGTPAVNQGGVQQTFVGQFLGANMLTNNQNSVVNVNTFTSGQAAGTIQVLAPGVSPQGFVITPGIYDASGSFDPINGGFTLSGTFPGIGTFTVTGTLPSAGNPGTYNLSVNGETFAGAIQPANLGTPTPPSSTPSPSPSPGQGDNRQIAGGTFSVFNFTPNGGYNGVNPPVTTQSLLTGVYTNNTSGSNLVTLVLTELGAQTRTLTLSIITQNGRPVNVGQTYQLVTNPTEDGALATLNESTGTTVTRGWAQVANTTGQMRVISLTDTTIEVEFQFMGLGPNSEIANNGAQGFFDVSGQVVANFITIGAP